MKNSLRKMLALLMTLAMVLAFGVTAMADNLSSPEATAIIDTSAKGSMTIYKYDLTNAEKDGVWDSSYVSTGIRDVQNVENVLNEVDASHPDGKPVSTGEGGTSYGYAIKGVEFTYVRIANIRTYTEVEANTTFDKVEVLYGIVQNSNNLAMLSAIGLSWADAYTSENTASDTIYYFESDTLIDALADSLEYNSTTVKNALESYVATVGGTAMPLTDSYGCTAASNLDLGLYLVVETKVPERVTSTVNPFLVSLPMTSVDGSNTAATYGGSEWLYDVTLYPKNLTGIPSLEKTVRESQADTGTWVDNENTTLIDDGYAHYATASDNDVVEYQIISTLPSITSASTYFTTFTFVDSLANGISYIGDDVKIEFYRNESCRYVTASNNDLVATWTQTDATPKFTVTYGTNTGVNVMTIAMTAAGLNEINTSNAVYTEETMVNSGYSDLTMRITYKARIDSNNEVIYGDGDITATDLDYGNTNAVVLTWKRSSTSYYDTLVDDAHVYTYGIDLTKKFSDKSAAQAASAGLFSKVEFLVHNMTDSYFVIASRNTTDGCYYVTGHTANEAEATHFYPFDDGSMIIKGLEPDTYKLTEVRTANAYTLLKDFITVVISVQEEDDCDIYDTADVAGLVQNDPRFASLIVSSGLTDGGLVDILQNMPQAHLEHKLLTASATVDGNAVGMETVAGSSNALAPLTVVNTRGFDLPQTGGTGTWMFPVIGIFGAAACLFVLVLVARKQKPAESQG